MLQATTKNNGKKHFVELEYSTEIDDDYLNGQVEFAYEKRLLYRDDILYYMLDSKLEEMIEKLDQNEIKQPSIYNFMAYIYKKLKPRDKDLFAQAVLDYPQESYKLYKQAQTEDEAIEILADYSLIYGLYSVDLLPYFETAEHFGVKVDLIGYLKSLNLAIGSVGYSPWGEYVCIASCEDGNFYDDLWNGYNFYDAFVYDEDGEIIDSCCNFYLPDTKKDIDEVLYTFNLDKESTYLVDNDASQYFEGLPFAEKQVEYSYSFAC